MPPKRQVPKGRAKVTTPKKHVDVESSATIAPSRRSPRRRGLGKGKDSADEDDHDQQGPSAMITSDPIIFAKKSVPRPQPTKDREGNDDEGETKNLEWLGYSNRLLNLAKTEEDLADLWKKENELELTKSAAVGEEGYASDSSSSSWETVSSNSTNDEWEEQLVYVELDDIPSIQDLFAAEPDDFLRYRRRTFNTHANRRSRGGGGGVKSRATNSNVTISFHNFASSKPVVQIGNRYFAGRWEEPVGSALFFRKKSDAPTNPEDGKPSLQNIVPEPSIPFDPVFGGNNLITPNTYELVATADKVLKTERIEASNKKLHMNPPHRQFLTSERFKVPIGYSATDLLAGNYKMKRTRKRKAKVREDEPVEEEEDEVRENPEDDDSSTSRNSPEVFDKNDHDNQTEEIEVTKDNVIPPSS